MKKNKNKKEKISKLGKSLAGLIKKEMEKIKSTKLKMRKERLPQKTQIYKGS